MHQEPNKGNVILMIIAIIGVCGTVIAATINVMGNINVEKIQQETELTRIALSSNPAQPVATQMGLSGLQEQTFEVNAKLDWQSTGISVDVGDTIAISYISGAWNECAPTDCPYKKPEGVLFDGHNEEYSLNYGDNEMIGCRHAALIARIASTMPVCVGMGTTFQSAMAGILEFRINDIRIEDNDGIVSVLVQVQK